MAFFDILMMKGIFSSFDNKMIISSLIVLFIIKVSGNSHTNFEKWALKLTKPWQLALDVPSFLNLKMGAGSRGAGRRTRQRVAPQGALHAFLGEGGHGETGSHYNGAQIYLFPNMFNPQECQNKGTNMKVDVFTNDTFVGTCGVIKLTDQLTQASQKYEVTCEYVGNTVILSKTALGSGT